jgi:hypothetical protein
MDSLPALMQEISTFDSMVLIASDLIASAGSLKGDMEPTETGG